MPRDAIAGVTGEVAPGVHHEALGAGVPAVWNELQQMATHLCNDIATNTGSVLREKVEN